MKTIEASFNARGTSAFDADDAYEQAADLLSRRFGVDRTEVTRGAHSAYDRRSKLWHAWAHVDIDTATASESYHRHAEHLPFPDDEFSTGMHEAKDFCPMHRAIRWQRVQHPGDNSPADLTAITGRGL